MGQILIRNVDDAILAGLKKRAVQNRTSAEEEARQALRESVGFDADAWREQARALRSEIGPRSGPTAVELLREDRYGDDAA